MKTAMAISDVSAETELEHRQVRYSLTRRAPLVIVFVRHVPAPPHFCFRSLNRHAVRNSAPAAETTSNPGDAGAAGSSSGIA